MAILLYWITQGTSESLQSLAYLRESEISFKLLTYLVSLRALQYLTLHISLALQYVFWVIRVHTYSSDSALSL